MIIKSCYIENFGTFREKTFEFVPGLNVIKEDNGWGKTTLATFIKVMFYGMEYSQARKELPERKKYDPWQGGNYGGHLLFVIDGKEYKIVRYFGKKKGEDEFELYNTANQKLSEDYSELIGEEIFGIDADSFERSIFVTLDGKLPEMQDSLNAKLNNLIDNTDDINNFEQAYGRLDQIAKEIKPLRGSGKQIGDVQEKIEQLEEKIEQCEAAEIQMNHLTSQIGEQNLEKKKLDEKAANIQTEIGKLEGISKKNEHEKLRKKKETIEGEWKRLVDALNGNIPTVEAINENNERARKIQILLSALENIEDIEDKRKELSDGLEFFENQIPTIEELESCREDVVQYKQLSVKSETNQPSEQELLEYKELSEKYNEHRPDAAEMDSYMDDYNAAIELKTKIASETSQLSYMKQMKAMQQNNKPKATINRPLVMIGAGISVLGIVAMISFSRVAGILGVAGGIVCVLLGFVMKSNPKEPRQKDAAEDAINKIQETINQMESQKVEMEKGYKTLIQNTNPYADISNIPKALSDIKTEVVRLISLEGKVMLYEETSASDKRRMEELAQAISEILSVYREKCSQTEDEKLINILRQKKDMCDKNQRIVEEYDQNRKLIEELEAEIVPFITTYGENTPGNYIDKMEGIRDTFRDYAGKSEELKEIKKEVEIFETTHDISQLKNLDESGKTLEELQQEYRHEMEAINQVVKVLTNYQTKWDDHSLIVDKKQDYESELENLREKKVELQEKHKLLLKTMGFLSTAKENLSTRYMAGMTEAFQKYMNLLNNGNQNIQIDTDLHTKMEGNGKYWKSDYFSKGFKDLVNVCTRIALIDAMYQEQEPFIILDDPFVNLDDEKLGNALKFIEALAIDRQVLYFVCQESRNL